MEKMYTAQEVADYLKIKKTTVYELIKRGELSSVKIGKQFRISQAQLDQYTNAIPSSFGASAPLPPTGQPETEFPDSVLKMDYLSNASGSDRGGTGFFRGGADKKPDGADAPSGSSAAFLYKYVQQSLFALFRKNTSGFWPPFPILPICRQYTGRLQPFLPGTPAAVLHIGRYTEGILTAPGNPFSSAHPGRPGRRAR